MSQQGEVLVLDGNTQAGLAVVRSLGRRGIPVTAGGATEPSLCSVSKFSVDGFVYPDPTGDASGFLTALQRHIEASSYAAVVPVSDHATCLVARDKHSLEATGTTVATEDPGTFSLVNDKANTFELVSELDVPAPTTLAPASPNDLEAKISALTFPVVIKSRSKSLWDESNQLARNRVFPDDYVDSPAALRERYRELVESESVLESRPPIVQEVIEGETTTTTLLAFEGEIRAYFQEHRLRTYPSAGGNSTLLTGMHDPEMLAHARTIVDELGWTGPAQVEFMRTATGEYYLVEVNGRYWGSLPLAIASGVDFPWLHYRQLRGLRCERPRNYRTDIRQRRLLYGDIKWLAEQLDAGNVRALWPFIRDFATTNHTSVSVRDPVPTVLALENLASLVIKTVAGRRGFPHTQW